MIPCVKVTEPLNTAGPIFVNVDEPDTSNEPVMTALPLYGNPAPAPAFNAYDAVVANDEEIAQLAVPRNETAFTIELVILALFASNICPSE